MDTIHDTIDNESATIKYSITGTTGPLLLLIPGAAGHASQFKHIIPVLSKSYAVVNYSRRGIDSPWNHPFNPILQCRDIYAIMQSAKKNLNRPEDEKIWIFGTSGGGVIAFQLAILYPEHLAGVIIHEAPTASLLPEPRASEIVQWVYNVVSAFETGGLNRVYPVFLSQMHGMSTASPDRKMSEKEEQDWVRCWRYDYMLMTLYTPLLSKIKEAGVKTAVLFGKGSNGAFYEECTVIQSEILGCKRIEVPGSHVGFLEDGEGFAKALSGALANISKEIKEA